MKKQIIVMILSALLALTGSVTAFAATAYTTDTLKVRKDPSLTADVVDMLAPDSVVKVLETIDSKWSKVDINGVVRYVATEYLKFAEDTATKSAAKSDTAAQSKSSSDAVTEAISDDPQPAQTIGIVKGSSASSGTSQANAAQTNAALTAAQGTATVALDKNWKYADFSVINSGNAVLYHAPANRKGIVVGVNAGHGTSGGTSVKTWCHPDKTKKVTGGTTAAGATQAVAVSTGMTFNDGTSEAKVNLKVAQLLKDELLSRGYDVLMIRDGDDVQLDNVARTVICNNKADCHIAIHFDGDGLSYDKGCFYMSVPDGIKYLDSVASTWQKSEKLGDSLISGLKSSGNKILNGGSMDMDLTQTSYSTVPSVDIELGNQSSDHSDTKLASLAKGLADGVELYFTK